MHSDDERPTATDTSPGTRLTAPLRRVVPIAEPQRGTVLAGVLSLAGVALGFGLGQVSTANSNCPHAVVVNTQSRAAERLVIQPSYATPNQARLTWLGVAVESGPGMPAGALSRPCFPAHQPPLQACGRDIALLGSSEH